MQRGHESLPLGHGDEPGSLRSAVQFPPGQPMARETIDDILAFLAVAQERSFTRAAGKLGLSQSALSHKIRALETRLGVRLLTRTTRSVSPTEAGERLLQTVGPRLEEIEAELEAVSELREKPAGTIRITAIDHVVDTILMPKLAKFLRDYPDIKVEITIDYGLTDIVAQRYDAGVRSGQQLAKGMIAVRIETSFSPSASHLPGTGCFEYRIAFVPKVRCLGRVISRASRGRPSRPAAPRRRWASRRRRRGA
jgi:DNA-binding transcriptional LysR family regulator